MYAVELNGSSEMTAVEMMGRLKSAGIVTRPFFKGLHAQPALELKGVLDGRNFSKTDHAYKFGFYLPSGLTLTEENIDKIVKVIKDAL